MLPTAPARTALLLLLMPAAVAAAEDGSLFDLSLEELGRQTVTIATRHEARALDAPAAVSVFTREDIDRLGATRLDQLLHYVPGMQSMFDTATAGPRHYATARGALGVSTDILVLRDGQPLNEMHSMSTVLMFPVLSLADVQRVEVIRGPGSALYGAGAAAGVINLVTGYDKPEVAVLAGSHRGRGGRARLAGDWQDWHGWVVGERHADDGEHFDGAFDSFGRSDHLDDPSAAQMMTLGASRGGFKGELVHSGWGMQDYYVQQTGITPHIEAETRNTLANLQYRAELGDSLSSHVRAGFQRSHFETLRAARAGAPADVYSGSLLTHDVRDAEASLRWAWAGEQVLTAGLSYKEGFSPTASLQSNYSLFSAPVRYLGEVTDLHVRATEDRTMRAHGAFAQQEWRAGDFSGTAGLRFDDYNTAGSAISPRATFAYALSERERLVLMASQAYRAPGLVWLYSRGITPIGVGGHVDPTYTQSVELQYRFADDDTQFSAGVYHNRWCDVMLVKAVRAPDPSDNVLLTNADHQYTTGLEAEWRWRAGEHWDLAAGASYLLRNELQSAVPLDNVDLTPRANAFARSSWVLERWTLGLDGWWYGGLATGEVVVFDANARLRLAQDWSLALRLENLLDRDYDMPALGRGIGNNAEGEAERNLPQRGRTATVELRLDF